MAGSIWIWTILVFLVVCSSSTAVDDLSIHERDDRLGRFHRDTRGILLRSWRNLQQNEEKMKSDGGYNRLLDQSGHFLAALPISMKINLLQRISEHEKRAHEDTFVTRRDEPMNDEWMDHVTHGKVKKPNGARFMGMRGKKIPTNFYGVRGKKASDKFLGMRGKKTSMFNAIQTEKKMSRKYSTPSQLPKRIPVGPYNFVGMRGKKSSNNTTRLVHRDEEDQDDDQSMDFHSFINNFPDQDVIISEEKPLDTQQQQQQQQDQESADKEQNNHLDDTEWNGEW